MGSQLSNINKLCMGERKCIHEDMYGKPTIKHFGLYGKSIYQEDIYEKETIMKLYDNNVDKFIIDRKKRAGIYGRKNKRRKRKKIKEDN